MICNNWQAEIVKMLLEDKIEDIDIHSLTTVVKYKSSIDIVEGNNLVLNDIEVQKYCILTIAKMLNISTNIDYPNNITIDKRGNCEHFNLRSIIDES